MIMPKHSACGLFLLNLKQGARNSNENSEDGRRRPAALASLDFRYCKGSASSFFHWLFRCLFSQNGLQTTSCKWGLCSSHHNSFSFSSVRIFTLHQTFVFLLRVSAPAFFFLNNVQNWCADLLIKKSRAKRAELRYLKTNILFSRRLFILLCQQTQTSNRTD